MEDELFDMLLIPLPDELAAPSPEPPEHAASTVTVAAAASVSRIRRGRFEFVDVFIPAIIYPPGVCG